MYDPIAPGVELAYTEADTQRGVALRTELGFDRAIDIVAAPPRRCTTKACAWRGRLLLGRQRELPGQHAAGPAGRVVLRRAQRAVPRRTAACTDDVPLRRARRSIPPEVVEQHRIRQPTARVHVYAGADHAFNRDVDNHVHDPASAQQAWRRTLDFLGRTCDEPARPFSTAAGSCIRNWPTTPIPIAHLALCDLLLMDDANHPWLILVPRVADAVELIDLDPPSRPN
jgi:carboxymethylenebutenolidase